MRRHRTVLHRVSPFIKQAVQWYGIGDPVFEYAGPSIYWQYWPGTEVSTNLPSSIRKHVVTINRPSIGNPIHISNIVDRFAKYTLQNIEESLYRPQRIFFEPLYSDLSKEMHRGIRTAEQWAFPRGMRKWLKTSRKLPYKSFPFVIIPETGGDPRQVHKHLANNPYIQKVIPTYLVPEVAVTTARPTGHAGISIPHPFKYHLPAAAHIVSHGSHWPIHTIVHEAIHSASPLGRTLFGYRWHSPQSLHAAELGLLAQIPYLARKETQRLARMGKALSPLEMIHHAALWRGLMDNQLPYVAQSTLPWHYVVLGRWPRRASRFRREFVNAFRANDLASKLGYLVATMPYNEFVELQKGLSMYLQPLYTAVAQDRLISSGADPKSIRLSDMLKAITTLPRSSFAHKVVTYGPRSHQTIPELIRYFIKRHPTIARAAGAEYVQEGHDIIWPMVKTLLRRAAQLRLR